MDSVYALAFLAIAFSLHEFFHAWVADRLGDPTPRLNGRVTLNPLAHLDWLGFLSLLVLRVGWGKPVPINPANFSRPRRDVFLVSLAGPLANLVLASATLALSPFVPFLFPLAILSFNLGVFNLLPIHPLDGFTIVGNLLPRSLVLLWERLRPYGIYFLLVALFPVLPGGVSLVSLILGKALDFFLAFAKLCLAP